jgi:hypothetical protein
LLHAHLDLFFLLLHHNVNSQVSSIHRAQHHEQQELMQVYHGRACIRNALFVDVFIVYRLMEKIMNNLGI